MTVILFLQKSLGLTVQDSVNLPPITLACLPLHETGLPLWSCILALCHHVTGNVESLALVLRQDWCLCPEYGPTALAPCPESGLGALCP